MHAERNYQERMQVFETEAIRPGGVVMVGSSHVEWFDAARLLPGRRIINRGIAGDRLEAGQRGVLHRLEISVFSCRPAAVIFESGTNDLGELWRFGRPALEEIVSLYERAVSEIRARLPDVPMALLSVFPTRGAYAGMSPLIRVFNARLPAIAAEYGCAYHDVYSLLVDDAGKLAAEFTEDGLHLNERGYCVWSAQLAAWFDRIFPGT